MTLCYNNFNNMPGSENSTETIFNLYYYVLPNKPRN